MKYEIDSQLFVTLFIVLISPTKSLYEDQAGKFDWRQQYVGLPRKLVFDSDGQSGKRIITATEEHVLASISARNGQIAWRHVFEKDESGRVDDVQISGSNVFVSLGGGHFIRSFASTNGDLVWESSLHSELYHRSQLLINGGKLAVLGGHSFALLDKYSGDTDWSVVLPNREGTDFRHLTRVQDHLMGVGVASGSHVTLVTLIEEDGSQVSVKSVPAGWITSETECRVVSGTQLVCLDSTSVAIQLLDLENPVMFKPTFPEEQEGFSPLTTVLRQEGLVSASIRVPRAWQIPMKVLVSYPSGKNSDLCVTKVSNSTLTFVQMSDPGSRNEFIVRYSSTHLVVYMAQAGMLTLLRNLQGASAASLLQFGDKNIIVSVSRSEPNSLQLTCHDILTGEVMSDLVATSTFADHHGYPVELYAVHMRKRGGSPVMKLVIISEDHSLALVQQSGKMSWMREESMASILSAELVDLPVSPILARMDDEFGSQTQDIISMFVTRFTTQFWQLKEFIVSLKSKLLLPRHHHYATEQEEIVISEGSEEDDYLTRDEFNLHKIIVVATAAGKLFGIDSATGLPEWKHYIPGLQPFTQSGQSVLLLFVQRTTAHFPLVPRCTLVGQHSSTGQVHVFTFNPITGQPLEGSLATGETLDVYATQITMLNQMDDMFLRPLLMLDKQLKYHVYPQKKAELVRNYLSALYMFSADPETDSLIGYNVMLQDNELLAQELWRLDLGREGQQITNLVAKRASEHVHSQGVVLGDRNVQYKYLNPNLVVVTTEDKQSNNKGSLSVYLVDSVTGHIVFQCSHKRVRGPAVVVHSENWMVYSYWNSKHWRTEVTVLELYEGRKQTNATTFSSLSPPPDPIVMRNSFVFNARLSAMGVTLTEKGITSKQVLMAMENGGIIGMPKILLDARRPLDPTQETREEGLIPYIPELPRAPEMIVNYHESVQRVHAIQTSPAGLESTSLVFTYGLDVFFTRVMPSKMFDVLKEDFDYFFIGCVLTAMILVSVISRKLAQRKALNKSWK